MAEYIDRAVCLSILRAKANMAVLMGAAPYFEKAAQMLEKLPAADVAPVVRCNGCKHYRNHPNGLCYLHTEPKTNARGYSGEAVCVEPDDFCSYGERKEGADNG